MVRMENNKAVVYYYIKDHLGSVKALVDENGNPVQEYEYGAYGKTKVGRVTDSSPTNFVENRYAYTSREWEEETGDYYYRARYYDPSEGRFLSEDPIGFRGGDLNLYRYVKSSPISSRDPDGRMTEQERKYYLEILKYQKELESKRSKRLCWGLVNRLVSVDTKALDDEIANLESIIKNMNDKFDSLQNSTDAACPSSQRARNNPDVTTKCEEGLEIMNWESP